MIIKNNNTGSRKAWSAPKLALKSLVFSTIIFTGIQAPVQAQDAPFTKPSWWIGAAAGANFNFYRGSTQKLNAQLTPPVAFHNGNGIGLFASPLIEYRRPESRWGLMLQTGYDSRRGTFDQQITPCDCPVDLSTKLSYITVEPSLRFAPFKASGFYLMGGPRLAFNVKKEFRYELGINPAYPDQQKNPVVKGDLSDVKKTLLSMQIGAGYDIPLNSQDNRNQFILSPFVTYQPYFGQSPRTIESWTVNTLRVGASIKFGRGKANTATAVNDVQFSVNSPTNITADRRVRETFPLRNYVFFNQGSTTIPDRYVLLDKNQVKDFKEDQLEVFTPKTLSGRSEREMTVYYNVLNILGDRMGKNPESTITLVGSSENGPQESKVMAETVKSYLVTTFGIEATRISIEGRDKPKLPSEQPGGTKELELLREGDRRVSIESNAPALLMEFQSGPEAALKPVEITAIQEAPLDSYVTFNTVGSDEAYTSWSMNLTDDKGTVQSFGPFMQESVSMPGKSILGDRPKGTYLVTMLGTKEDGTIEKMETTVNMVLWTPAKDEEGQRYSVLYEFNDSKTISTYEKYLTEIVTPKIPQGGKVIIHGYTDIIGDETNNRNLSLARANDVKRIIEASLAKAGRKDVTFEVQGFGEDQSLAPFDNKFPEERFYNRTVIIDIIPGK
ncbi:OmpA family protein [Pontibacter sp. BT731]|uniref:OmpA family protein n=1 Tax=Pontibacter coccineus TaxID=3063328 RepID=UPI0026E48890|nr:OmpA family protein [Pontibacter sp. BT731]MDO6391907.1 OmpA family protein [Pontibacter sp. BT731]